jgi:pimeloyl-ACP methyl ester carboxylesterase
LTLLGAVSIAPASGLSPLPQYFRDGLPGIEAAESFIPLIALGAQAADPTINARRLLSDAASPLLDAARTGCIAQIRQVPAIPATQVFRASADLAPLSDYLARQDPSVLRFSIPTMIAQGTADTVIPRSSTDALVATLCAKGIGLDYRLYANADHRASIAASLHDAEDFVDAVMAGRPVPNTCAT